MRQAGKVALVGGLISLVIGIISRMILQPVMGIEAHAFIEFTQACFLFAIATFLGSPAHH